MSTKAVIEIGNQPTTELLFTYPNDGHADQSLQETVEHYFNDSIRREGLAFFKLAAEITPRRKRSPPDIKDSSTTAKPGCRRPTRFARAGNGTGNGSFSFLSGSRSPSRRPSRLWIFRPSRSSRTRTT